MYEYTCYYNSPLGEIMLQSSNYALNKLSFLDNPQKTINRIDANKDLPIVLIDTIKQLTEYFEGIRTEFDIPMDQAGTDFQQLVWRTLSEIPFGKTVSYLQLSRSIGNEKAIRAVGTSNGKNNIAIIVPCHRVIGSDGSLTGYAGELWRKQWLLEHEGVMPKTPKVMTLFDL